MTTSMLTNRKKNNKQPTALKKNLIKKEFCAAFLLAGTAIGSGMLSLPMVLAKFGIISSCAIMIFFAAFTHITAMIRADLNVNFQAGATLAECGQAFGCANVGMFGNFLLKLLSFSLIAAYLFGLSSILKSLCNNAFSQNTSVFIVSIGIVGIFLFASEIIVNTNKTLFIAMFCALILLILKLLIETKINVVPLQVGSIRFCEWSTLVPIIFTSFGFQGSMHSVTKLCDNDRSMIRKASFLGCTTTALMYIIWTVAILLVVANTDTNFFQLMVEGKATDVGTLVKVLSQAASSHLIQTIVWIVSTLAILTSILGAGLALLEILEREHQTVSRWKLVLFVVLLPAVVSIFVPDAFVRILNISGIILAGIAIIVPVIILRKKLEIQKIKEENGKLLLRNKIMVEIVMISGIAIVGLGLMDLLK